MTRGPEFCAKDLASLQALAARMRAELEADILPFWLPFVDRRGGFYGLVRNDGGFDASAPKGLVMHSRFLWAYSAAYRRYPKAEYLEAARSAYDFLRGPLLDAEGGGFWWSLGGDEPLMQTKLVYGQAFAVYALSEYFLASGERAALESALRTFGLLERVALDRGKGGYFEACDRWWSRPERFALSDVDIVCDKSMNTNLHVLEALSNLYRASQEPGVRDALAALLEVFAREVFAGKPTMSLYFDRDWSVIGDQVSWGHDIEAAWLMNEAAELLHGDPGADRARACAYEAIRAVRANILEVLENSGGSLPRELAEGRVDESRDWWIQAEGVVGNVDAWQATGDSRHLAAAVKLWDFIEAFQVDHERGEWFWRVSAEGAPDTSLPKGGLWKTCYHNGRACLEVMARAERATGEAAR